LPHSWHPQAEFEEGVALAPQQSFLPSRDGFAFTNSWPPAPAMSMDTGFGEIDIGNAANGLCGGMVFAVLDYWYAGKTPPVTQPKPKSALYKFLVKRIIDSWHVPVGAAQYFTWMNLPDGDVGFTAFGHHVTVEHGISGRTISQQWPAIRADLDRGIPSALGLVTVESRNPAELGQNHQVLAYAYDVAGSQVTLHVYDPNSAQDDTVTISFDTAHPTRATKFNHTINIGHPIRGFFRTAYSPAAPPG
jgi:hypothetical protein